MKIFIGVALFCALLGLAVGHPRPHWYGLYAQYTSDPNGIGVKGFFEIPLTSDACDAANWFLVPSVDQPYLTARCLNSDVRLCALYDNNGNIAGYQIAVDADELDAQNVPYRMTRYPLFERKVYNGINYWVSTNYLVSQGTIRAGGRRSPIYKTGDGIWFKTGNSVTNIPFLENDLVSNTLFRKQNCIDNMGTHYTFNSSVDASCDDYFPNIVMVKDGQVVGVSLKVPGNHAKGGTPWFEPPPPVPYASIYPQGPTCFPNIVQQYGLISLHVYFIEEPYNMKCTPEDSIAP